MRASRQAAANLQQASPGPRIPGAVLQLPAGVLQGWGPLPAPACNPGVLPWTQSWARTFRAPCVACILCFLLAACTFALSATCPTQPSAVTSVNLTRRGSISDVGWHSSCSLAVVSTAQRRGVSTISCSHNCGSDIEKLWKLGQDFLSWFICLVGTSTARFKHLLLLSTR